MLDSDEIVWLNLIYRSRGRKRSEVVDRRRDWEIVEKFLRLGLFICIGKLSLGKWEERSQC